MTRRGGVKVVVGLEACPVRGDTPAVYDGGLAMTPSERLARFDMAQAILGYLMAACSERIYFEGRKAQPDAASIGRWETERDAYFDLDDALRLDDQAGTEQVIATYGPLAQAISRKQSG